MKSQFSIFKFLNIKYSFQISNFKFQIILIGLLGYLYIGLFPPAARAEGISLSISPSILKIEAIPPANVRTPIVVGNENDQTVKLKVIYKFFRPSDAENGDVEYLGDKDPFFGANKDILDYVKLVDEDNFSVDSLELGPKQQKKLDLLVNVPKNEKYSDYYFSIIFMTAPQAMDIKSSTENPLENNFSTAQAGIAANVLLSIGPNPPAGGKAKGSIQQFTTPWYTEAGPVPFTVRVKNDSGHFITSKGIILIKNMFGQTIGRVEIPPTNILAGSSRAMQDTMQLTGATTSAALLNTLSGKNSFQYDFDLPEQPKVIWPESFLLGLYTANLSLALSEEGPILTRTIYFFAFPMKLMLGLVIAGIIVLVIVLRVRKRLKTE